MRLMASKPSNRQQAVGSKALLEHNEIYRRTPEAPYMVTCITSEWVGAC
jgi:hypothetical protein